jgi:glycosyltransferase involved in cell wall biosynthesis
MEMPHPSQILWITRQDPRSSDSGELIYSLGIIRALASQPGIRLTVLAHHAKSSAHGDPSIDWQLHGTIPNSRIRGLASNLPSDAHRLGNPTIRLALKNLLARQKFHHIIIDQAACAWALDEIPTHSSIIHISHNHEASVRTQVARDQSGSLPMKLALRWDAWKYGKMEHRLGNQSSLITAITPRDADAFATLHPGKPIITLPPGYDRPIPHDGPPPITPDRPRAVVLAGAFEWIAKRRNLTAFLTAAEPAFRKHDIRFDVVGKADPSWFEKLARQHPWATFTPNVPSVTPFLEKARIGLIPEALGGGFKLKALDYIFAGLPLAAIHAALSGVPINHLTDAITADEPAPLASRIAERIDDLDFLNRAAQQSFAACRNSFSWQTRGQQLASALGNLTPR